MRRPYLYVGEQQVANQAQARGPYGGPAAGGGYGTGFGAAYARNDPDLEEEKSVDIIDNVLVNVRGDVFGAAFVTTMRALGNDCYYLGSAATAWLWVALALAIQYALLRAAHIYAVVHSDRLGIPLGHLGKWTDRLETVINQGLELNSTATGSPDDLIKSFCFEQPEPVYYQALQFVWCCWMSSHFNNCRTLMMQLQACPLARMRDESIQETDESMTVVALTRMDAGAFGMLLVMPRVLMLVLTWYVGIETLALRWSLHSIVMQVLAFKFISSVDTLFFHTFLSHSKKAWVQRCQVVQRRGRLLRMGISWPGELGKLLLVLLVTFASWALFRDASYLRYLCSQCTTGCSRPCSRAFSQCEVEEDVITPSLFRKIANALFFANI